MAYADFTLQDLQTRLDVRFERSKFFPPLLPYPVPSWLPEQIERNLAAVALVSEKSRSEVLVIPTLVASTANLPESVSVFSGHRLDVDPQKGLIGECDFILAKTANIPLFSAPIVTVVEAKKGDLENALGQCAAQMVGAMTFNERAGHATVIYGAVTSGDLWQFLRGTEKLIQLDPTQFYRNDLGLLLAAIRFTLGGR